MLERGRPSTVVGALEQANRISWTSASHAFVDNGYKGYAESQADVHVARKKNTYATRWLKQLMKRRNAFEALFNDAKRDE